MAFQAHPAFVGAPEFGIIHINAEETAKAFQAYLNTASRLTGVSIDDISRRVSAMPVDVNKVTLFNLLQLGMKLFDAVVWLHAGRPATHPLQADPTLTADTIPSMHDVARSVFYAYFMLLTQARYPAISAGGEKPRIPNFLKSIMGMAQDQTHYMDMLTSFPPQQFDPAWVRFVHFSGFGQEVLSRFGLGVAGYRMFGPFKLYPAKDGLSPNLVPAFAFARTVARAPASWDIHPLTRNPNILTARGNLNKNLGNLILECFTDDQIAEMVAAKIIFKRPDREAQHMEYRNWIAEDNISGTAQIFS